MHRETVSPWQHEHTFGQEIVRAGESRTWWVIALTTAMMLVEIAAGVLYGSMALLADGLHMASHAGALGITAVGYVYARRHAADPGFSFGTGKVNSLAGFAGALLLGVFAVVMAAESLQRFVHPVAIAFDEAIFVAVVGLAVNGLCVRLLHVDRDPAPGLQGHHAHEPAPGPHGHHPHEPAHHADGGHHHAHHHDHNLRSAYLHVLADALTSLLAIFALLSGKYLGLGWMDPAMGIVGAVLVARWAIGLLRETTAVLLDRQAPEPLRRRIAAAIEVHPGDRVSDLHVWSVGPGIYAAIVSVVTDEPGCASRFKARLPDDLGIVHASVEVQHCQSAGR